MRGSTAKAVFKLEQNRFQVLDVGLDLFQFRFAAMHLQPGDLGDFEGFREEFELVPRFP